MRLKSKRAASRQLFVCKKEDFICCRNSPVISHLIGNKSIPQRE